MGQVTRYSESEQAWNKSEQNRITELQLARGFQVADIYLNRAYLDVFSAAPIISLNRSEMDISKLRLFEISKLVFDAEEKFTDKLMSVYSALHSMESSIASGIEFYGLFHTHFYGVSSLSKGDEVYIKKILEAMPQSKKELFFPIVVLPDKKIISYRCYLDGSNLIVAEDPVMCVADFENSF